MSGNTVQRSKRSNTATYPTLFITTLLILVVVPIVVILILIDGIDVVGAELSGTL